MKRMNTGAGRKKSVSLPTRKAVCTLLRRIGRAEAGKLQRFKQDDSEDSEKQRKEIDDSLTGEVLLRSKRVLFKKFINEKLPKLKPAQVMKAFAKFWTVQKTESP